MRILGLLLLFLLRSVENAVPPSPCACEYKSIWTDVMLLVDGSNAMSEKNFHNATSFIKNTLNELTIGQADQFQTRVGALVYSDRVYDVAQIYQFRNNEQFMQMSINYTGQDKTNLSGAIDFARDRFAVSVQHRPSARKVMLIATSTYRAGAYDPPHTTANTFKDNGGIIIVLDLHGEPSDILKDVASPGYYLNASDFRMESTDILSLLCSANCYCPQFYSTPSPNVRGEPTTGCFLDSSLVSDRMLAERFCKNENNGTLATPTQISQQLSILKDYTSEQSVWVGLQNNGTEWIWSNGAQFNGPVVGTNGSCAVLRKSTGFHTQFTAADCKEGIFFYSCQTEACSSTRYCTKATDS